MLLLASERDALVLFKQTVGKNGYIYCLFLQEETPYISSFHL